MQCLLWVFWCFLYFLFLHFYSHKKPMQFYFCFRKVGHSTVQFKMSACFMIAKESPYLLDPNCFKLDFPTLHCSVVPALVTTQELPHFKPLQDFQTFHMILDSLWSYLQQYRNPKSAFIALLRVPFREANCWAELTWYLLFAAGLQGKMRYI